MLNVQSSARPEINTELRTDIVNIESQINQNSFRRPETPELQINIKLESEMRHPPDSNHNSCRIKNENSIQSKQSKSSLALSYCEIRVKHKFILSAKRK